MPGPQRVRSMKNVIPFLAGFATALIVFSFNSPTPQHTDIKKDDNRIQETIRSTGNDGKLEVGSDHREKVMAVIGVQTGFTTDKSNPKYNYALRRQALRKTWFPSSQTALDDLRSSTGIVMRFVIGHSDDSVAEAEIDKEEKNFGGFLRLPLIEGYSSLTNKTFTFFRTVIELYNVEYIIKVDDDTYLRVDRIPAAISQWKSRGADYIGCMKTGEIFKDRNYRWYEPQHAVLGSESYFTHCWGTIYILSGHAAQVMTSRDPLTLRYFANEDVTVGSWMLSMNVKHYDDRRLCEKTCSDSSIAVFDFPQCAGLCDAAQSLPRLHAMEECRRPALPNEDALPMLPSIIVFDTEE